VTSLSEPARRPAPRSFEHRAILTLALGALAAFVALGLWLEPDPRGFGTHEQLGFDTCWMVARLGVPCPGCGVTTAVALAARGELGASVATQPFGTLLAVLCVLTGGWALAGALRGRDLWQELARLPVRQSTAALLLALGGAWAYKIARMRGWL
jgi:hypothetical protein